MATARKNKSIKKPTDRSDESPSVSWLIVDRAIHKLHRHRRDPASGYIQDHQCIAVPCRLP